MQASKTNRYIADIIGDIVKESLNAAKKRNKKTISEGEDLFGSEEKSEPAEKEKSDASKETDSSTEEEEKLKLGDVSVDDVIEKLNTIRSGKSFKDEEIMKKLDQYVTELKKPEKTALLAFLKALSQIVTGEVETKDVVKPSSKDVDVKMEKEPAVKKATIKPIVIKKPAMEDEASKKTPAEDTKGPVPITAKKK